MLDNIKTPLELYKYLSENIKYGFVSKKDLKSYIRNVNIESNNYDKLIVDTYFLQTPNELLNSKCGICFDQVELERKWFKENNYEVLSFYSNYHNHVFLVYKDNNKYYLFENCLYFMNGITEFDSLNSLFDYYFNMQLKNSKESINNIELYKYDNVSFNESFNEFITNRRCNEKIIIKNKKTYY